jgi:hypothetical protein
MSTISITLTPNDLEIINAIVQENDIKYGFNLVMTSGSGIGYTLDLEYETELNGRDVTVKVPVTGVENW